MRHVNTASRNKNLVRVLAVVGSAVFALAGCAADGASGEGEASTGTAAAELRGGGGGLGFTCENGTCTCSKEIEGDCDRMRINCTGDLSGLDACLKGWLTTDCSCSTATRTVTPPRIIIPRTRVSGVLAAP